VKFKTDLRYFELIGVTGNSGGSDGDTVLDNTGNKKGYFKVLLAGILWGSTGIYVKFLGIMGADSALISCTRYVFGFVIILIWGLLTSGRSVLRINLRTLICCAVMGLFCQTVFNLGYTEAIDKVGMSMAAILLYTAPVYTAVWSLLFFREKFSALKTCAFVINIAGCALAVTGGAFYGISLSLYGVLMGILAALMYSLSPIIGRFATEESSPVTIAIYMFLFAAIFTTAFSRPWVSGAGIIGMKFLVLGILYGLIPTAAAYILYFGGVSQVNEISRVPVIASVEAVTAALIGVVAFNENMNIWKIFGIALVILSIYLMNRRSTGNKIQNNRK